MKRIIACILCTVFLFLTAVAGAEIDYNVAEKFLYQLAAPSGFQAELKLDLLDASGASRLREPLAFQLSYMEKTGTPRDKRLELVLVKDSAQLSSLNLRLYGTEIDLQADVLSPDWYRLGSDGASLLTGAAAVTGAAEGESLAEFSGIPAVAELLGSLAPAFLTADLSELTEDLTTRLDLWLEGYRGATAMENGAVTVCYEVPASALKAEVKTLLLDVLEDEELLAGLTALLSEEDAALYLSPAYREYYFDAVDALPLSGSLKLERTVTKKGETAHLLLSLPLYDDQNGAATLVYERTAAEGDTPQEESLLLYTDTTENEVIFNRYTSADGLRVWSGSFRHEGADGNKSLEFTLNHQEKNTTTADGEECTELSGAFTLIPGEGCKLLTQELEAAFSLAFQSPTAKKASTKVEGSLSVGLSGEGSLVLTLSGATVKAWDIDSFTEQTTALSSLDSSDLLLLLGSLAGNVNSLLANYTAQ